jgi:hypothetical protein
MFMLTKKLNFYRVNINIYRQKSVKFIQAFKTVGLHISKFS